MSFGFVTLLAASVGGGLLGVGVAHIPMGHASSSEQSAQSVAVFVDATLEFREKHMANQLTKSHAKYQVKGYRFADMEPYVENSDLEGFSSPTRVTDL